MVLFCSVSLLNSEFEIKEGIKVLYTNVLYMDVIRFSYGCQGVPFTLIVHERNLHVPALKPLCTKPLKISHVVVGYLRWFLSIILIITFHQWRLSFVSKVGQRFNN